MMLARPGTLWGGQGCRFKPLLHVEATESVLTNDPNKTLTEADGK